MTGCCDMDIRDLCILLIFISYISWFAGFFAIPFINKEERKYLIAAFLCLHSQWPLLGVLIVFLLLAVGLEIPVSWITPEIGLVLLICYLSLGSLYFLFLLFHSIGKKKEWIFFCTASLISIFSFACGTAIFLIQASQQ